MSPNGGPFKYFLLPGKHAGLLSLDEHTGLLRTRERIDREKFPKLEASVEVQDNGKPSLSARYDIVVDIVDENDSPSHPRSIDVIIKNYEGTFPGGEILTVRPTDPDLIGQYQCSLLKGAENIFTVSSDCLMTAGRIQNGREYELRVLTNDGKHEDVEVQIRLSFVGFGQFAVQESVVMKFSDTATSKVLGFFKNLRPSDNRIIDVLSITQLSDGSVACFVSSKQDDKFLIKDSTIEQVNQLLGRISTVFTPDNVIINQRPLRFQSLSTFRALQLLCGGIQ